MIAVHFKPTFVRQFKKLPSDLQDEVIEKIHEFKHSKNHKKLKVHKLRGALKNYYSFSIDYKNRIVFQYENNREVGDHNIYR